MTETQKRKTFRPGGNPKLLRVAALKPPIKPVEKDGEDTVYCIHYVTMDGKAITDHPCTKSVFTWLRAERPWFNVRDHFVLNVDPETGVVTHVSETRKPDLLPSFKRTPEEGREAPSKYVKIALYPDGSSAAMHIPERVSDGIITEIQQEITSAEEELHPGTKIGRFILMERREVQGETHFIVDPMPR